MTCFEVKVNKLNGKKTFEKEICRHSLKCIVLKFHKNRSRNEEVMFLLLSVHAMMLHPVFVQFATYIVLVTST